VAAINWYKRAAELGHLDSMCKLAFMYRYGEESGYPVRCDVDQVGVPALPVLRATAIGANLASSARPCSTTSRPRMPGRRVPSSAWATSTRKG
jgi:hypothetical protein